MRRADRPGIRRWVRLALLVAPPLALVQCNGDTTQVACLGDFGTSDAGLKVQAFIETANALVNAAGEIDSDLLNACRALASDLGIPAAELGPSASNRSSPGAASDAACRRVKTEIDKIIHADLAVNAHLAIVYPPPVCTIDAEATLRCEQLCDPTTVAVTRLTCAPGKFYGACMGSCMGTCRAICATTCAGSCTGTCTGTCAANCNGVCEGTCSTQNANGTCYGPCAGTCTGTCDGTCTGACDGTCTGSCGASCLGVCEGTCAAWVAPPQCTEVTAVTAVADCQTTCDARGRFAATCTEPSLVVTSSYVGTATGRPALLRLLGALGNTYPRLVKVGHRAIHVVKDPSTGYATALHGVAATASLVGPGAVACVDDAIIQVDTATAKIDVAVRASLAFTASVAAAGGAAPI